MREVGAPAAPPSGRKERLKQRLKRVPILSTVLLFIFRALKMPSRLLRLEHKLVILDDLVGRMAALQDANKALLRDLITLHELGAAQSEKLDQLRAITAGTRGLEERLTASVTNLTHLVTDSATKLVWLHEKSDRSTEFLSSQIRSINPVMHAGRDLVIGRSDGFIMAFPAEEWRLPAYQILAGPLEPGLVKAMKAAIHEGMTVVDIGANVGTYTLLALRAIGVSGKVYTYEPTPRTFAILKDNVQINGFLETGRIILRQKAVTDGSSAKSRFFIWRDSLSHNSLYPEQEASSEQVEVIEVDSVSLDEDLGRAQKVDVVKIDAEGAEPAILRGMRAIISNNPSITIFIEFAPIHLTRANLPLGPYLEEIRGYGFEILAVDEPTGELKPITDRELVECFSVNLMLRRPGRA
jgi:FkbM family methyltransferase